MISKEEFLRKIKTEIFPSLLKSEKERSKSLLKFSLYLSLTIFVTVTAFALFYKSNAAQTGTFWILLIDLANKIYDDNITQAVTLCIVLFFFLSLLKVVNDDHNYKEKQYKKFLKKLLNYLGCYLTDLKAVRQSLFPNISFPNNDNKSKEAVEEEEEIIENLPPSLIKENSIRSVLEHSCLFGDFKNFFFTDLTIAMSEEATFSATEFELEKNDGKSVFDGICLIFPANTHINGYTLLFNTKFPPKVKPLQKLKSVPFLKNYQIFSDNPMTARLLLTRALADKLSAIKKCFKDERIDIAFLPNHVILAIHTKRTLFAPFSLFKKATNLKHYEKCYDEIKCIYDFAQILNDNNLQKETTFTYNKQLYKEIAANRRSFGRTTFIFAVLSILVLMLLFAILYILIG